MWECESACAFSGRFLANELYSMSLTFYLDMYVALHRPVAQVISFQILYLVRWINSARGLQSFDY